MAVSTFTKSGAKATAQAKLDKAVFSAEIKNHALLKQAYETHLANGRANLAKTKTRGLVRGGGKKPWRQKGTGRARFGSSRNPIWRGGGIAFGPTGQENYSKSLNKKARHLAIKQALTLKAAESKIIVVEALETKAGKTGELAKFLEKVNASGLVLVAVDNKDDMLTRAARNLPNVKLTAANYLNVFDVLNADNLIITQQALTKVNDWLGGAK